jgi:enoyl-[acyl-carrier protein] reductase I
MLLADKRILVTGVLNDASIAFAVAKRAQEEGAEIVLTSFGRAMSLTQRAARRLPTEPALIELDVSSPADLDSLAERVGGQLDGVLHAIGFAPESCLGGGFLTAPWEDVPSRPVSAYSLKALAVVLAAHATAAPWWRSTSTTVASPGPCTTGWASPRPRSRPPLATSLATSAPTASA